MPPGRADLEGLHNVLKRKKPAWCSDGLEGVPWGLQQRPVLCGLLRTGSKGLTCSWWYLLCALTLNRLYVSYLQMDISLW